MLVLEQRINNLTNHNVYKMIMSFVVFFILMIMVQTVKTYHLFIPGQRLIIRLIGLLPILISLLFNKVHVVIIKWRKVMYLIPHLR